MTGRRVVPVLVPCLLLAVTLAALAPTTSGQENRRAAAFGIEVREGRRPAPGVEIRLESEGPVRGRSPEPQVTDAEGRAEFWWLTPGIWRVDLVVDGEVAYFLTIRLAAERRAEEMGAPARDADAPDLRWKFFRPEGPPPEPAAPPVAEEAPRDRPAAAPRPVETPPAAPPVAEVTAEEPPATRPEPVQEGPAVEEPSPPPLRASPESPPERDDEEPAAEPSPSQPVPQPAPMIDPTPVPDLEDDEEATGRPVEEPAAPAPPPAAPAPSRAPEPMDEPADGALDEPVEEPVELPADEPVEEPPAQPEPTPVPSTIPPQEPPAPEPPPTEPPQQQPEPVPPPSEPPPSQPPPTEPPPTDPPPPIEEPPVEEPPVEEPQPVPDEPPPTAVPSPQPPPSPAPPPVRLPPGAEAPQPVEAAPVEPAAEEPPRFAAASGAEGTCPECRADEVAITLSRTVPPGDPGGGATCAPEMAREALQAAQRLAGRSAGIGRGMPLDGGGLDRFTGGSASCQVFGVVLPPGVRYRGYTYGVEAGGETGGPCYFPSACPVAGAVWTSRPVIEELADGSRMVYGVFRNAAAVPLRASLTVFYIQPGGQP